MTGAAIGVFLVATIVTDALLALGIVLTGGCLLAMLLYAMRSRAPATG
jgi:MFS transporter, DHA1 family, multidrug resistance protein